MVDFVIEGAEVNTKEKGAVSEKGCRTKVRCPRVNSLRQKRALVALVRFDSVSTPELEKIAGVRNAPELMAQLNRNGFDWDCEIFEVLDRDGILCRPGRYKLKAESKRFARKLVQDWALTGQV